MERLTMARFASMVVLLVAAALASQPSTKPEESEFRQKILQNLNETNQKLNQLIRIVDDQVVETRKQNEFSKASNDRLDQLARTVDLRLNQTVERVEQEVKNFNESTFERIYQLEKQIDQEKRMELDDREKLDALVNLAGRHIQFSEQTLLAARCTLARSSKLTFLSNDKMQTGLLRTRLAAKEASISPRSKIKMRPRWSRQKHTEFILELGGFRQKTKQVEVKRTFVGMTGPNWSWTVPCGWRGRTRGRTAFFSTMPRGN
ncbi:uncharacterized protein LOC132193965 isoform X2 [Neocloeon triangulifer]|uniref:uncharacterized protein LOC132193965 isoform X2 n=1 Tax=Neocloeon triangulifer TaxID=2078957 RepID=UPI00286ECC31|nr:uncharacterized protein LOC132193965 isoform X2 [Neocloeon triangulifer]